MSHPMWVRGLKLLMLRSKRIALKSHPMWVRGLKRKFDFYDVTERLSHPMWVRGLKHNLICVDYAIVVVAPHVGAWIETLSAPPGSAPLLCRTPCGCVD